MAAYAALVSLLNNIHTITKDPSFSTSLDNTRIQPLLEKTAALLDFVVGNNYGAGSEEAKDLERQIVSAVHAAEDLIESHIVNQIHMAEDPNESIIVDQVHEERLGCHVSDRSEKPSDLQQINEVMDALTKMAMKFKKTHSLAEEQIPTHLARPPIDGGDTSMVGLDDELKQLLDKLTRGQPDSRIISIVGMGGTGKTTLAKSVYENPLIKETFQFRGRATISQQHNAKKVLSKLLPLQDGLKNATVDDLGVQLHKILLGKRYLILLDDIWSVGAWDEVKHFFPNENNGSRILLTTRLSNVAKDCGSSLFPMDLLDEEKSWKLFCEKAFQDKICPPELDEVAQEIVSLCKGLALSIVVVGGLLSKSPSTLGYWRKVAKDLKLVSNSEEKQESLNVLSLSYNHLPPRLKPCFLYMGVFKEDSEIHVSRIINLWIAEGFIKPIESLLLEEIAEGYINDLIDRNLILVGKRRMNGKVRFCGIHDLSRDLCIKLADQEEFFNVSIHGIRGTERRLVDDGFLEWSGARLPLARSIITSVGINQPTVYRLLRVLDQGGHNLQSSYYENVNLRYLAYDHPDVVSTLWELPISLSLIWNLQTLIISNTFICVIVAPTEFWKMIQLRHVQCEIYLPCPPRSNGQDGLLMLENLQTLRTVVNLRLCEEVCKIIPNIKKLHLAYDRDLLGYDDTLIEYLVNLNHLHKLKSLNLLIRSGTGLFPNRELKEKLPTPFLKSLKKLSLSSCKVQCDDMTMIGSLQQLEVLNMENLSFGKGEWSPIDHQFLVLKFLKINSCDLVSWVANNSHFLALRKLFLINLWRLKEIPSSFEDLTTLELIRVDCCSESAAISAVKIQEVQRECNGTEGLQVEISMRQQHIESFRQMLEIEELTTDNIQLEILS